MVERDTSQAIYRFSRRLICLNTPNQKLFSNHEQSADSKVQLNTKRFHLLVKRVAWTLSGFIIGESSVRARQSKFSVFVDIRERADNERPKIEILITNR